VSERGDPALLGRLRSGDDRTFAVEVAGDVAFLSLDGEGLRVVDFSDPTAPFVPTDGESATRIGGLHLAGDYLYGTSVHALDIYDVSDWVAGTASPAAPAVIGSFAGWGSEISDVQVDGDLAAVRLNIDGLRLLDVADPTNPVAPAGGLGGDFGGAARAIALGSGVVYAAEGNDLQVVDISTPHTPVELALVSAIGFSADEAALASDTLFLAGGTELVAFDVSTPATPVELGRLSISGDFGPMVIEGEHLYAGVDPVLEIDVADPANMSVLAGYSIVNGAVDLQVRNGVLVLNDRNAGLVIAQLDRPRLLGTHFEVSPAADITYGVQWPDGIADEDIDCSVSSGSCVVSAHDRVANTASVTWTAPTAVGDHALQVTVGDWISFGNAQAQIRVQ